MSEPRGSQGGSRPDRAGSGQRRARLAARVAVCRGGEVLLVNHVHPDRTEHRDFWCFPGGGVEPGEGLAEAAVREVREETGLEVALGGVFWIQDFVAPPEDMVEVFFLARPTGGRLTLGTDPDRAGFRPVLRRVEWVPCDRLGERRVLPAGAVPALCTALGGNGWTRLAPLPSRDRLERR